MENKITRVELISKQNGREKVIKTGEIAYYKDGVLKQGRCCVDIGHEPNSEFWQELKTEER